MYVHEPYTSPEGHILPLHKSCRGENSRGKNKDNYVRPILPFTRVPQRVSSHDPSIPQVALHLLHLTRLPEDHLKDLRQAMDLIWQVKSLCKTNTQSRPSQYSHPGKWQADRKQVEWKIVLEFDFDTVLRSTGRGGQGEWLRQDAKQLFTQMFHIAFSHIISYLHNHWNTTTCDGSLPVRYV